MAIVAADWSVDRTIGDIRYIGGDHDNSPSYASVIEFHRWLQGLADDASSVGDDELDITDQLPSSRSTDNIIRLLGTYNIDAIASEHLYDGSIIQGTGGTEEIYDGIVNFGNAGIVIQILQNGQVIADDWWNRNGGLNADSAQGISHRFMLKIRTSGADIDGRRLLGITREFGNTYGEFGINGTARGNNVLALSNATDLNNATAIGTVAGWTGITLTTQGFTQIDVDNNTVNENYYSEWNTNQPIRSINQFFERMKWIQKDPVTEDFNADIGSNFTVGNGTIAEQAQSFSVGVNAMMVTKLTVSLKKVLLPTGTMTAELYAHTGTFGSTGTPTGATLATSNTIDVSKLTTTYQDVTFQFSTPVELTASTKYFLSVKYSGGDVSNYVTVEGLATTGTHGGNRAQEATGWSAAALDDLNFAVYTSTKLYGIPSILFRGITHELTVNTPTGTFSAFEPVSWAGGTGQMLAINSTTAATKMWIQLLTGVAPTGTLLITAPGSGATVNLNTTVTDRSSLLTKPFIGASTGSAIIGGYGIGIETADLSASDKLFDLTNTQITPPNNVTFTVSGLVIGEDRVLVAPWDGVSTDNEGNPAIDKNQLTTTAVAINGATVTSIPVTVAIPTDTPSVGDIRILTSDGRYVEIAYTSYSGSTFTIPSTDFSGVGDDILASSDLWIAYIDKLAASTAEAVTMVYLADRDFVVIVRDGAGTPIKEFISSAQLLSTGGSITAIRTSDA